MKIIGRTDKADFPELDLKNVPIKVDTGAYTSSIHCHHIKEVEIDGERLVEFELLDPSHNLYQDRVFRTKNFKQKKVKSSFGDSEERYIVTTEITLFGEVYSIDLSLSERSNMKYPILMGRRFLKKKFVVDTSVKDLSYNLNK
ncbi:MAG: ATP-dependent zinc protease [Flavobacteriales bacterium]